MKQRFFLVPFISRSSMIPEQNILNDSEYENALLINYFIQFLKLLYNLNNCKLSFSMIYLPIDKHFLIICSLSYSRLEKITNINGTSF